jgi:gamma-glutamyltranspeptidase/glutathione hydrolase
VAAGFAIGVLEPNTSGLGGGGFMVIKLVSMDEPIIIDFREMAPAAATPNMFLGPDGRVIPNSHVVGGLASGTPGDVAGLLYALEHYGSGRLTRQQIMQPAIDYAENGYVVTENFSGIIMGELEKINSFPATAAIYTDDGLPWEAGSILKNPDLANTLRLISAGGADAFYHGPLAEKNRPSCSGRWRYYYRRRPCKLRSESPRADYRYIPGVHDYHDAAPKFRRCGSPSNTEYA